MKRDAGICLLLASAAIVGSLIGAGSATATSEPCKKGYVVTNGLGTASDTDGNGFVCVNPTTGEIRDDKGSFIRKEGEPSGGTDDNDNGFVCYDPVTGVVVDDNVPGTPTYDPSAPTPCPPGYALYPSAGPFS